MPDESQELARFAKELVFRVAAKCFDGTLPPNPFLVVDSILRILPAETTAEKLDEIRAHVFVAVCQYQAMDNRLPL